LIFLTFYSPFLIDALFYPYFLPKLLEHGFLEAAPVFCNSRAIHLFMNGILRNKPQSLLIS